MDANKHYCYFIFDINLTSNMFFNVTSILLHPYKFHDSWCYFAEIVINDLQHPLKPTKFQNFVIKTANERKIPFLPSQLSASYCILVLNSDFEGLYMYVTLKTF